MKAIKLLVAGIIFVVSVPVSWYAAWISGGIVTLAFSIILPTYGLIYAGTVSAMGNGFVHELISWVLGFIGAFVSLSFMHVLTKGDQ